MYKYPFREQMLIYAQRPDATACALLELWNEKMNCWVNKGAQCIALIDEEGLKSWRVAAFRRGCPFLHRSSKIFIDKQANDCYYLMLVCTN